MAIDNSIYIYPLKPFNHFKRKSLSISLTFYKLNNLDFFLGKKKETRDDLSV